MDTNRLRRDFPVLNPPKGEKPVIYLDNAATTLKPQMVIDAMVRYYATMPANVHRGLHRLSEQASEEYEKSHDTVARFLNAKRTEVSYTQNTTSAINTVMYSLLESGALDGKEILLGRAEHHANLVPWQFAAKKAGAKLRFIELDQNYAISTADLESKVSKKTAIVSVAHIPNTLAAINDVKEIARITHDAGALCMVDAAQSAPHLPLDVRKLDCDFMAFSGHKMCGPTGIGVLYGKEQLLSKMEPFLYGGSMIHSVSYERSTWNHLPDKFEAGTPPIGEAFGLKAAIEYLQKIGLDEIRTHERALTKKCLSALLGIDGVRVFGPKNDALQGGIVLFDFPKVGCHELALALDEAAHIAIRSGMHCAEPIVTTLNPKGVCRASFYLYNTSEEIEVLTEQLAVLSKAFGK